MCLMPLSDYRKNKSLPFLTGLLDKTPYNITVTPLFDDKTGHGAQVLDICSREGGTSFRFFLGFCKRMSMCHHTDFENMTPADPGNVNISVVPGHQSAYVSWDVRPQDVCSEEVVSFTIFYSTEQGPELSKATTGLIEVC